MDFNLTDERLYEIEQEFIKRCDLYCENWITESFSFFSNYKNFDKHIGMFNQCPLKDWMIASDWMPFVEAYEYDSTEYFLLSDHIYKEYKKFFLTKYK